MKALQPIFALWRAHVLLRWWRWALRELSRRDPCHADIPYIVHRIRTLEAA